MGAPGFPASSSTTQDAMPLGTVVQSPINLEKTSGGRWRHMGGQVLNRYEVDDRIAAQFPLGPCQSTARTLAAIPGSAVLAASPTYFVAPGVVTPGTLGIQYSADGTTWSNAGVVTASMTPISVQYIGSRWLVGYTGGWQVTTADNPNSTWVTLTIAVSADAATGNANAAYSPQLGRAVLLASGATTFYSLDDGATAAVSRTKVSSTEVGVVWTGQRFLIVGTAYLNQLQESVNGTNNFTAMADPNTGFDTTLARGVVSDGNGTVVIYFDQYFLTSNDHGVSWSKVYPPFEALLSLKTELPTSVIQPIQNVFFSGGMFLATTGIQTASGFGVMASAAGDGKTWQFEPVLRRGSGSVASLAVAAIKGTTLMGIYTGGTANNISAVIDPTKFRMPATWRAPEVTTLQVASAVQHPEYMKVRM